MGPVLPVQEEDEDQGTGSIVSMIRELVKPSKQIYDRTERRRVHRAVGMCKRFLVDESEALVRAACNGRPTLQPYSSDGTPLILQRRWRKMLANNPTIRRGDCSIEYLIERCFVLLQGGGGGGTRASSNSLSRSPCRATSGLASDELPHGNGEAFCGMSVAERFDFRTDASAAVASAPSPGSPLSGTATWQARGLHRRRSSTSSQSGCSARPMCAMAHTMRSCGVYGRSFSRTGRKR